MYIYIPVSIFSPSNLFVLYDCFSLLIVFYFESLFCLTVKWFFAFIKSSPALSLSQAIGIIIFSNLLPTTLPKIFQTLACQVFKEFSSENNICFVMFFHLSKRRLFIFVSGNFITGVTTNTKFSFQTLTKKKNSQRKFCNFYHHN